MTDGSRYQSLCGWRGIDATQRSFASQFPALRRSSPHLFGGPTPIAPVLLYKAWTEVLGSEPAYPPQQIGDCVSFGHGHGNDLLQCVEIKLGEPFGYRETDTEFIYASSRQVAGLLGHSDGSYGAAAVKAMTTIGMISREMLGSNGAYTGERAKSWGLSGPPHDVEVEAASYKLGAAALVSTWDELVAAITNGYPVTICTDQGFALIRDADGFCTASGIWGHCMLIAGLRFDRPGACVLQSWGPNLPTGPTALGQPTWSFWAEQSVVEAILSEGDSWALSRARRSRPVSCLRRGSITPRPNGQGGIQTLVLVRCWRPPVAPGTSLSTTTTHPSAVRANTDTLIQVLLVQSFSGFRVITVPGPEWLNSICIVSSGFITLTILLVVMNSVLL